MQLDQPLRVVTPSVDAEVLSVLARATSSFSARRVYQLIGSRSEAGVRRALDRLAGQGVVLVRRAGQAKLYELNRRHLAAPYIEHLAQLRDELVERLSDRFQLFSPVPSFAALFGSAARGGMRPDSGVDIFITRPGRSVVALPGLGARDRRCRLDWERRAGARDERRGGSHRARSRRSGRRRHPKRVPHPLRLASRPRAPKEAKYLGRLGAWVRTHQA
ncbi:MAG: nucleotidyltransferase domain-containing protein [Actinomycetota bacterium]|nr:nucleotidyltransferase domain-containing protein [Actinomycetota bacterium]